MNFGEGKHLQLLSISHLQNNQQRQQEGKKGVVVLVTAIDGGVKLEGVQRNQDEKRGNH